MKSKLWNFTSHLEKKCIFQNIFHFGYDIKSDQNQIHRVKKKNHSLFVPILLMILFQVSPDTNITSESPIESA